MSIFFIISNEALKSGLLKNICSQNCPIYGELLFKFLFTPEVPLLHTHTREVNQSTKKKKRHNPLLHPQKNLTIKWITAEGI